MKSAHIVVARYKEDISWVRKLSLPVFVYNKGEGRTKLEGDYTVTKLPNVGHEGHTFVHHILQHYDNLPEKLVLLQGDPFDHCAGILDILAEVNDKNILTPLSQNWKHESLSMEYNWEGFTPLLRKMATEIGLLPEATLNYGAGAQYIVPKSDILKRPRSYYEQLLARLERGQHPLEGWVLERLWPYVFGYENKTEKLLANIITFDEESSDALKDSPTAFIDFRVTVPDNDFDFASFVALETQDFVFVSRQAVPSDPQYYIDMIQAFKNEKFSRPTESDPVVVDEQLGVFMTHRYVLLQHISAFDGLKPNKTLLQARGVPVFILSS